MFKRLSWVLGGLLACGSVSAQQIVVNEVYRDTMLNAGGTEWLEIVLRQDMTAAQLEAFHVGDAQGTRLSKLGAYKFTGMAAIAANFVAGTVIVVSGGGGSPPVDVSYNPGANDFNLVLRTNGANITAVNNGGDFAGTDVAWVDNAATGTTITAAGFCISWTPPLTGTLGQSCQTAVPAPANGGGIMLSGSVVTDAATQAQWVAAPTPTPGQPNGGTNTSSIDTLRGGSPALPTLSINSPIAVVEGDAGNTALLFTVALSAQPAVGSPVTVTVSSTSGSATDGTDYSLVGPTSLTFTNGDPLTQTVTVNVIGDLIDENDEDFTLTLASPVNATIAAGQGVGTGAITDDDAAPLATVADISMNEGNAGTTPFVFTLTLSHPSSFQRTVFASTADGTAVAPGDYVAIPGNVAVPVIFAPLQTTQTFTVQVVGDTALESNETFLLNLSNGPLRGTSISDTATATIVNDDAPANVSVSDVTVTEGTGAGTTNAMFTVTLSAQPLVGSPATVNYATASGTAISGTDFTSTSGTLTFINGGALTQTVSVPITRDSIDEANETFVLNLSNAANATITDGQGIGTIVDDDTATLTISDLAQAEGNGGGLTSFVFTITTSSPSASPISVNYQTTDISATAPADYQSATGTATIAPGATSTTVTINVVADDQFEPTETFRISLTGPVGATIADAEAIGSILGDDSPVMVPSLDSSRVLILGALMLLMGGVALRRHH